MRKSLLQAFTLICCLSTAVLQAQVPLQNADATFVRAAPFAPANSIDNVIVNGSNGWATNGGAETTSPHTLVFQTVSPLNPANGYLQFEMPQRLGANHTINDFRISATTAANPTTATASWTELTPSHFLHAAGGLTLDPMTNRVTSAGATQTGMNNYTLVAPVGLSGITGFRLEMFPNPTDIRAASNGNVVLTEFQVFDGVNPINVALDKPTTGDVAFSRPTSNGNNFAVGSDFTHADNTSAPPNNPFWQVDLEGTFDLDFIEIVDRGDGCCTPNRLEGSTITVFGPDGTTSVFSTMITGLTNPSSGETLTFDNGGMGIEGASFIRVDGVNQYFQFSELRAFATPSVAAVPEPATMGIWSLLAVAFVGFGLLRYRRRK